MKPKEQADRYLESNFPESQFEDGNFDINDLYDAIPNAYLAGYNEAINKTCCFLKKYFVEDHYGMSPSGYGVFEFMFREFMEK